jgi:ABC-type phosphate transport system substrate-binding protein
MKRIIALTVLCTWLLGVGAVSAVAVGEDSLKLVVNPSNPVSSVTRDQASRIFLKKSSTWDNGQRMMPVDLDESSPVRAKFSQIILGKDLAAVSSYWQRQIFSGGGTPPPTKGSDAEVLAYVRDNPGAVGYVSATADTTGVKVIQVK